MRAAVLHAPGDLRFENVPEPGSPGPDEAIVRVQAAGICGSDIGRVMVWGTYRFPTIPGHEFAGVVERIGTGVTTLKPGDKVAVAPLMPCFDCEACKRGQYSLCDTYNFLGSRTDGGFAELVKAPVRNLIKVPQTMDLRHAAAIEPAAIILHGIHKVNISLHDSVMVVGTGALGYFAVQFAKLSGASPVIAVDIDEAKLALAKSVGADICINASQTDAAKAVAEATGGRGVDLAIECAGNNAGRELCFNSVRKQGTVLVYGSAHSDVSYKGHTFEKLLRHEITMIGSWNSYSVPFPGREWFEIVDLMSSGRLQVEPFISHSFGLEAAPKVFRDLAGKSFGPYNKILFTPNG